MRIFPRVAAALLMIVGALHVGVNSVHSLWDDWLTGELRSADASPDLLLGFSGLRGSFAVVMIALGIVLWSVGIRGHAAAFVGTLLTLWAGFCLWVVGFNPAFIAVMAAGLLVAAAARTPNRSSSPDSVRS